MLTGLVAALTSAALFGVAAVWQARASRALPRRATAALRPFVRAALGNRLLLLVVAAYLLGFVLHAVAIWLLPLYLAQATVALSLPITAICSAYVLREPLGPRAWGAVASVTVGIALLAFGAGPAGEVVTTPGFVASLWVLVAITLLLGVLVRRRGGAAWLGAIAGLGYAGSALAVRGVGPDVSVGTVVAALAVPTISLVAFWLYSLAMTRTRVAAATGALLTLQTFAPAVIGVLVLGDRVRSGWGAAIVLGLVVTTAGATALANLQRRQEPG